MRKISMFLICSTLLAVPAFAEDCPQDQAFVPKVGRCYTIARTTNNAEATAHNQPCYGDQKPAHSIKTGWQYYPEGDICVNACKQDGNYVCCACGVYTCEKDYERNSWATACVKKQGVQASEEATEEPVDEPTGGAENPEAQQECVGGTEIVEGQPYTCAIDANGATAVVNTNETCQPNKGINTENTKTCAWKTDIVADTYYACKATVDGPFVRCVYRITECVDDNFELRDGGLACQQTVVAPAPAPQPADPNSISILAGRLAKVEGQFGLSKWRTADGEFNKARLASDLTAGVVLGTTGALVTASVVKKKQVKEGFEALECTIGGQRVGDYGDKFHISGK